MADIELVIKIPEEIYELCKRDKLHYEDASLLEYLVANGTPLPKGHGRIIDESQVMGTFTWDNGYIDCYAPTIIEADKESEDKE